MSLYQSLSAKISLLEHRIAAKGEKIANPP